MSEKNFTDKDKVKGSINDVFGPVVTKVLEEGKALVDGVKKDIKEIYSEFLQKLKEKELENMELVEVDVLTSAKIVELAKGSVLEDSNEVYVWKKQTTDSTCVHIAYGKDHELINENKNKFIIIKAGALAADVINLFEDSDLVILK